MDNQRDSKQLCLFCKDTGRVIVDHVGVLTTTTDCPVGCEDKMFEGCEEVERPVTLKEFDSWAKAFAQCCFNYRRFEDCEETPHYFAEIDPESDPC